MPPEEDWGTTIGNMQENFGKDQMCSSKDMIADRQTDTHTEMIITMLCSPIGGGVNIHCESKKQDTKLLTITSPNIYRFRTFFADGLRSKFASLNNPPCLKDGVEW